MSDIIDKENMDDIDIARETAHIMQEEDSEQKVQAQVKNISLTETDVHFVGDRTVIAQVIQALSYIRHALRNNEEIEIKLSTGIETANVDFNFDVNGFAIPDLVPPAEFRIN